MPSIVRSAVLLTAIACSMSCTAQAPAPEKAADAKAATPGLSPAASALTDKQRNSTMIGMDIAKSLKPMKDEVDMATLQRAINDVFADKKPLLNEEQAMKVMQTFAQKMQVKQQEEAAKKQAEMEVQGKKNVEAGAKFLAENSKKTGVVTTASGLQYQVLTAGKGAKPTASDSVKVHYTGTLLDGTKFDSSIERGEPAQFVLNSVVPGWTEALQLMPVGSKYKLWIPSKLGYGEQGTPGGPIPPNSTLVFDVELIEIVKP